MYRERFVPVADSTLTSIELMNLLGDGMVVVDQNHIVLFANPAAAELLQKTHETLIGKPFPHTLDPSQPIVRITLEPCQCKLRLETRVIPWEGQPANLVIIRDITEQEYLAHENKTRDRYFHIMMENATDMLALFDETGTLFYINPAMERTLGYTVAESTGKHLSHFFKEESASFVEKFLSKLPATEGERLTGTADVVHKDGSLRTLSTTTTLMPEKTDSRVFVVNCHDITETIEHEKELREIERRFRKLFQVMPYPVLIVRSSDAIILETNDHFMPKLKINLQDIVGTPINQFAEWATEYETIKEKFHQHGALRGYPATLKKGSLEISLLLYAETITYGEDEAILISFVDITQQNEIVGELARLYDATSYLFKASSVEELAQDIVNGIVQEFNQVDCGLMLLDASGEYLVRAARAGEYGILLDDKISIDGPGLVPQAFREGHPLYAADVSKDEAYMPNVPTTASEFVIPLKATQGIIGVLDFQSQRLDGFSEGDQRLLAVFSERASAALENMQLHDAVRMHAATLEENVEERTRKLTEALEKQRELLRVKTRFVSMISHEYRTPLTVISSSASILQRYADRLDDQKKERHLAKIQNQVHKLNGMLQDVLEVNRAETSGIKFSAEEVDVQETVSQVVAELQRHTPQPVVTVEVQGTPRLVALDKRLFKLIVENLVSNALKYSPADSTIDCRLGYQEDRLLLQVTDQGIGIPADEQEKLFSAFHRASNVGQIPGTGLGLSIVRQSVEAHNGNLSFESEEGRGTTFTITLPTAQ